MEKKISLSVSMLTFFTTLARIPAIRSNGIYVELLEQAKLVFNVLYTQMEALSGTIEDKDSEIQHLKYEIGNAQEEMQKRERNASQLAETREKIASSFMRFLGVRKAYAAMVVEAFNRQTNGNLSGEYVIDMCHLDQLDESCAFFMQGNLVRAADHLRGAIGWQHDRCVMVVKEMAGKGLV